MTLFVCGTSDPVPDNWGIWDEITLLIAESEQDAEQLTYKRPIVPVDMSKPCILMSASEPNMGEDL